MSSNLQNSIWPNAGGTLGQNKVQIPDGVTTPWPEGDALVHNFVYNKGKLVGFVDTKALIANDSKSTTFPYDYVNITVDGSLKDTFSFNGGNRTKYLIVNYTETFNSGDTIVLGTKYATCKTLDEVKAIDNNYQTADIIDGCWNESLYSLESGNYMFNECSNLTTFISDLNSLTSGSQMFRYCLNLTNFTSDLSSLTLGYYMFNGCTALTTFTSDSSGSPVNLSSLTNGESMFDNCSNLKTFNSNLGSLTRGYYMFNNCTNLTNFTSDLSSLTNGFCMFVNCKLNTDSTKNIAETIKDVRTLKNGYGPSQSIYRTIHISLGNSTPNTEEIEAFNTMVSKGWTVYVNGSVYTRASTASIMILDENGEETVTPIPYWAKPINSDEKHAHYVDSEGNFYNILGGNFIYGDNLETYGMFTSKEDAAAQMRLKKIGEVEIESA